jgi:hypothetical protein
MMRVLITATEWKNFFWLRNDKAADPTIAELAKCMREAYESSAPTELTEDDYHLPFVKRDWLPKNIGKGSIYSIKDENGNVIVLPIEDAIKVSAARCAAQSFRNTDYNLEKSLQVYDRLVNGDKIHAGALEHQAKPMKQYKSDLGPTSAVNLLGFSSTWENGVSHQDREGNLWSGNFKGWVQHRKTIKGENYV